MIELCYWPTPNGHKITMFLEEAGLEYTIHPVDISGGDQFKPEFLAISPNNRMPAIVDLKPNDGGKPISVFEFRSDPCLSRREDASVSSLRSARPEDGARVGILAGRRARSDGRAEPPFCAVRAGEDSVCD